MAARRRKFFQQIGGTIQEMLANLDTGGHFELVRLIRIWPEVVGETIMRRTEVNSLKFHTAVVRVSTAMWRSRRIEPDASADSLKGQRGNTQRRGP